MTKQTWLRLATALMLVVTVGGLGLFFGLDHLLTKRLTRAIKASCGECTLNVGHLRVRGGAIVISHITFTHGAPDVHRRFRVVIDEVTVWPRWWPMLLGRLRLDRVDVRGPQVTMIDHAEGRGPGADERRQGLPAVEVDRLSVEDGTFIYVRERRDTRAVVAFRRVRGNAPAFGTTSARRGNEVRAHLTAQLGFSGEVRLAVSARPAAPHPWADVELWINDQNLADLGAFFEPNAGVALAGEMQFAHATSHLRGDHLATRVRVVFNDFNIAVERTRDRDGWTAFFTNLGISLGIKQSNVALPEREQTREITSERARDEGLISFLLRGIKDAAFSVAKKPAARALTE